MKVIDELELHVFLLDVKITEKNDIKIYHLSSRGGEQKSVVIHYKKTSLTLQLAGADYLTERDF